MAERRKRQQVREPIELTAEEARQNAPPPHPAPKSGKTPAILILLYGAGLGLGALAVWAVLILVR
jgi:hypothetical protein